MTTQDILFIAMTGIATLCAIGWGSSRTGKTTSGRANKSVTGDFILSLKRPVAHTISDNGKYPDNQMASVITTLNTTIEFTEAGLLYDNGNFFPYSNVVGLFRPSTIHKKQEPEAPLCGASSLYYKPNTGKITT